MYMPDNKEYIPVYHPNLTQNKTEPAQQPLAQRIANFDEVSLGYTLDQAMEEASRCLNCPGRYCAASCPAHVPVPEFIALVRAGELEKAYQLISGANCLPSITGRVCAQECQCEKNCTRAIKGEAVAIGRLEAFVADWHQAHAVPPLVPEKGESQGRVAIIGSGPAGLACAERLAREGVTVEIFEQKEQPGGVLAYGIPGFSLPDKALQSKLAEFCKLGVIIHTGQAVTSVDSLFSEGYDAVFVGIGACRPVKTQLEGEQLAGIDTASEYLSRLRQGAPAAAPESVAIIGGGNTAIDAARSAIRLGAKKVQILYRRAREDMPARQEELKRALEEGVELIPLTAPVRFAGEDGAVSAVECVRMETLPPAVPNTRPEITLVPNSESLIPVQQVILATGYQVAPVGGIALTADGRIQVGADGVSTSRPKVYAAGDAVTGPDTLVRAMAGGLKAAESILRQLNESSRCAIDRVLSV